MSPRLPRWTAKQLIRFLQGHGFEKGDQTGSHLHLANPQTGKQTTVPVHAGKIIGLGLLKAILTQAGISTEDI
jgi:mRNA interferase HicA